MDLAVSSAFIGESLLLRVVIRLRGHDLFGGFILFFVIFSTILLMFLFQIFDLIRNLMNKKDLLIPC